MALASDLSKVQKKKFQRDGIQDSSTGAIMVHHNQSSNTTKKTRSRRFKRGIQLTTKTMLTYARI
jgi:hypothetical protein